MKNKKYSPAERAAKIAEIRKLLGVPAKRTAPARARVKTPKLYEERNAAIAALYGIELSSGKNAVQYR